jgi:pimeloyl-ACP methyl ester carboxylesterase
MRPTPVYFIPGTQCDERLWQWLWPELHGLDCRHLAIPAAVSVAETVELLAAQLPAEPVRLVGFSLGGYLAAALTVALPRRVERLLVCANSASALPNSEIVQRAQLLNAINTFGYRGMSDHKIAQMVAPENLHNSEISDCLKAMDKSLGVEHLTRQLSATSARCDLLNDLAALTKPMVYCYGDQDHLVNAEWLASLQQRNHCVRTTQVPHSGHMLPLEQPKVLAKIILAWC